MVEGRAVAPGAAAPPRSSGASTPLGRVIVGLLGALVLCAACAFHFVRNVTPGRLSPEAMERVEVARHFANTGRLSSGVIRPLVLHRLRRATSDGRLSETRQAPLYPLLAGAAIKLGGGSGPGQGDRVAAGVSLLCFVGSLGVCYLLALRLFGTNGALLGTGLYALGASALSQAIAVHPTMLATALFTLLLAALYPLDVTGTKRRASVFWAVAAGVLWSLLFLTIYSALLLLIPLVWYLFVVTKRDRRAVAAFVLAAIVLNPLTLAYLYRNAQVAGNPLFNGHLLELVMGTEAYPGASLYRAFGMPQSVPTYLASGGVAQIMRKATGNLLGYYQSLPGALGVLVLPLFLVAALTRFTNPVVNRMRTLVYVLLLVHVAGLSLFVPYTDGLPLLLLYAPFASIVATVFLLNFLRARNLPPFYARATLAAWVMLACLPGVAQLLTPDRPESARILNLYSSINAGTLLSPPGLDIPGAINSLRSKRDGVIVSDAAREIAFYNDLPVLWLPPDYGEVRVAAARLGKPVRGIVLTPLLSTPEMGDPAAAPWRIAHHLFASVYVVAFPLNPREQGQYFREFGMKAAVNLPQEVRELLSRYRSVPVPEDNFAQSSLIWWEPTPHRASVK